MSGGVLAALQGRLQAAAVAASPAAHDDHPSAAAGRQGEDDVAGALATQQHQWLPGINALHVFRGVRLPDPAGGRKEIDLILFSHDGVCAVEVKNWSGSVTLAADGQSWVQHRRDGTKIVHPSPAVLLRQKANLLRTVLFERCGFDLGQRGGKSMRCAIVLPNSRLSVDGDVLAVSSHDHMADVIVAQDAARFYRSFEQTVVGRLQAQLLPVWLSQVRLTASELDEVVREIGKMATWDTLHLHGGCILCAFAARSLFNSEPVYDETLIACMESSDGDFVGIEGTRGRKGLERAIDRRRIGRLVLDHNRNRLISSGWALLGWEPSTTITGYSRVDEGRHWLSARSQVQWSMQVPVVQDAACILFRQAGDADGPRRFVLNEVNELVLSSPCSGSRHGGQRKLRARARNRSPSVSPQRAERNRSARGWHLDRADQSDWILVDH